MSADNAIAILITQDNFVREQSSLINLNKKVTAYRVSHLQCPDNFDYYCKSELHNLGYWLVSNFELAPVFYTEQEALAYAFNLMNAYEYVEHGIIVLDARKFNFPGH